MQSVLIASSTLPPDPVCRIVRETLEYRNPFEIRPTIAHLIAMRCRGYEPVRAVLR
jgi:hypothetical protein